MNKRVQFYKGELDDFGMPSDFQSYLIRARRAEPGETAEKGAGIAKVYTLSEDAIPLNPDHVVGPTGVEDSIDRAVTQLRALHPGYQSNEFDGD